MDKIRGIVSRGRVIWAMYAIAALMIAAAILSLANYAPPSVLLIASLLSFGALSIVIMVGVINFQSHIMLLEQGWGDHILL